MFLFSCLLCLTSFLGVMAQTLTQSSSMIRKPGETLKMSCVGSGFQITDRYISWVQQVPGKGLTWIGRIDPANGETIYSSSYQGRFTMTSDKSINTAYLQIDNVKVEDTATYFCARHLAGGYRHAMDVWGKGTSVTVSSANIVAPQVFPLNPFGQGNSRVVMACMVYKYFPGPITVEWNTFTGEAVSGENNVQFPLSGNPQTYNLVTQVAVSNSEWDNNNYTCKIKHFSTIIEKNIPRGCSSPEIAVQILQGTCFSNINSKVELSCQAQNLATKDVIIKWFVNEQERSLEQDVQTLGRSDQNLYSVQSKVNIFLGEWNHAARVKCLVKDTKTGKSAEAVARKCAEKTNPLGIEVTMVPPTIDDLYVLQEARIPCVASNLKDLSEISFTFDYPGAPATKNVVAEDPELGENGMYSVTYILTVSPETWLSHTEFTCVFNAKDLPEPIIRTISKKTETNLLAPIISVYPPSTAELATNEDCSMICVAKGFSPSEIYMGWTENGETLYKDQYINNKPKRNNKNGSFSASSILRVPCEYWNEGRLYSCLVGHEANAQIFVRSPIDKSSGNPAKINVSVNMSDTILSCM